MQGLRKLPGRTSWQVLAILAAVTSQGLHAVAADMEVTSFIPAPGDKAIAPDVPLHMHFASTPKLVSGNIKIFEAATNKLVEAIDVTPRPPTVPTDASKPSVNMPGRPVKTGYINGAIFSYYPVIITGNDVEIFPSVGLDYNKTYYVTVDKGAMEDENGGTFAGITDPNAWRFSTKDSGPIAGAKYLVVSNDGKADFGTLEGALDFVPQGNTNPVTIFLRKGLYQEIISFNNKAGVTILGEDRKETIIDYANNPSFNRTDRGMFLVRGDADLTVANLTIRNSNPVNGGQVETIIVGSSPRAILNNVDFYSTQDTIQINSQAYLSDCYIQGTVDFIWGTGPCYFDDCHITSTRTAGYYTQIRNRQNTHGYVFNHCIFDGTAGIERNVFARIVPSVFPYSEVVMLNSTLGSAVSPKGWLLDRNETDPQSIHFWEYNSKDTQGKPADLSERIPASKELKLPADKETIDNFSNPTWVLGDNWTPAVLSTSKQVVVTVLSGQKATLLAPMATMLMPAYQWQKDGADIAGATGATYVIGKAEPGDAGKYTIKVSDKLGKVMSAEATVSIAAQ